MESLLCNIKIGDCGIISHLDSKSDIYRRLIDIGMTEGTLVQCLRISSGKSLILLRIRGSMIALRSEDLSAVRFVPAPIEYSMQSEVVLLGTD